METIREGFSINTSDKVEAIVLHLERYKQEVFVIFFSSLIFKDILF